MENPALKWNMEVKDGKRLINGMPAEEFIASLDKRELLKVVAAGLKTLNDFTAKESPKPPENPQK